VSLGGLKRGGGGVQAARRGGRRRCEVRPTQQRV
jgi:hypothetical protein